MNNKSLVRSWIRHTTRNKVRYYSVVDAITVLVRTKNPRDYWYHVKNRPMNEHGLQLSTTAFKGQRREILPYRLHRQSRDADYPQPPPEQGGGPAAPTE